MKLVTVDSVALGKCLEVACEAGVPLMVWGSPGGGKTAVVEQAARAAGGGFWPIHLSSADFGDIFLPVPDQKSRTVQFYPCGSLPWNDPAATGIVLLDDLAKAQPAMQPVVMNLVHDRYCHGHTLAAGVQIVATGNGSTDAGNMDLCDALKSRMVHLYYDSPATDPLRLADDPWVAWALAKGIDPDVIAHRVMTREPKPLDMVEQAVCNDRSREMASRVKQAAAKVQGGEAVLLPMLAGAVGQAEATKLVGIAKLRAGAPTVAEVLAVPDKARLPEEPSVVTAFGLTLVGAANRKTAPAIAKYAIRLPAAQCALILYGLKQKPEGAGVTGLMVPEVSAWLAEHRALFML